MARRAERPSRGVVLPAGHTGSSLFHHLLTDAAGHFPKVFESVALPERASAFKRNYGDVLARFEAARVVAPERVEIARCLVTQAQSSLEFASAEGRRPLADYLAEPVATPALRVQELNGPPQFQAEVPFEGKLFRRRELLGLGDRLVGEQHMSSAARAALGWIVQHIEDQGGTLDLRGQNFAVLGAGAELACSSALLRAGARVLWIDLASPAALLGRSAGLSGTLVEPEQAGNLLEQPREIAAAIRGFADAYGPVHLGQFAYASGASQEWRLGAAMNAIASQLPEAVLRSVSLLVSPTTTATMQPESTAAAQAGLAKPAVWQSILHRLGLLAAPGYLAGSGVEIARATVSVQGLSYQAAQYISKLMAAETWAVYGIDLQAAGRKPVTVSANVAGITRTRSLAHPLFQAAFVGAPAFGVRIFNPETTRALSGLLILHDLLNPGAPGAAALQPADAREKARALFSQQVHGGLYGLPFVLEHAIRIAAVIGMSKRPGLLLGGRSEKPSGVTNPSPA